MKRTPLARKTPLKATSALSSGTALKRSRIAPMSQKRRAAKPTVAVVAAQEAWFRATQADPVCASCRVPVASRGRVQGHHVVPRAYVKRHGGDEWDLRNRMTVCEEHHMAHHHGSVRQRLGLALLTEAHWEFARDLLGDHAEEYLAKRYWKPVLD